VNYFSDNESGIYEVERKRNIYYIYQNSEFYIQGRNNSMSVYSAASDEILLTLKMKEDFDLNLKNNNRKYSIVYRDGLYRVFNKLVDTTGKDENLWSLISVDTLSKYSIYSTTIVDCLEDDLEFMNYIGLAILLIIQNKMIEFNHRMSYFSFMMTNRVKR
jgi:hypothetical protein